jgi:competence protein ComEC
MVLSVIHYNNHRLSWVAIAGCWWLVEKRRLFAWRAAACFATFLLLRAFFLTESHGQKNMIVYNIPRPTAIDVANGRSYSLIGDTSLLVDDFARNYHLQPVDLLVLSGNALLYISSLSNAFVVKKIVIDGSVPRWKAALWKRDCDSPKIPCWDVSEKGAFVMNW